MRLRVLGLLGMELIYILIGLESDFVEAMTKPFLLLTTYSPKLNTIARQDFAE